jgi:putative Mg2+ transporter-C (MgtC) family protein
MEFLSLTEIILRLGAAMLVGAIIGLNREITHKPAGMRTHALVSLGTAMITVISIEFAATAIPREDGAVLRTIQGIVTGIGFIGGGVILRIPEEQTVTGLTTAASIWIVCGLGIACGFGAWKATVITVVLAMVVLILGDRVEQWVHHIRGTSKDARSSRTDASGNS